MSRPRPFAPIRFPRRGDLRDEENWNNILINFYVPNLVHQERKATLFLFKLRLLSNRKEKKKIT